ncbi:MAG: DUF58 domain-containing protein [Bdellovibrionales bacterium]
MSWNPIPQLSFEVLRQKLVRENRIYTTLTARGLLFLGVVVVMVLTAATYNNNLIFILCFFMFAVFVLSMLQTHSNIKGVRLEFSGADDGFEGESQTFLFQLVCKRPRRKKLGLRIRTRSKDFETLRNASEEIAAGETVRPARIEVRAGKRGYHPVPEMVLETFWPLGLVRAWKVFRPHGEVIVYPRPLPAPPLQPVEFAHGEQDLGLRTSPEGDFGELKPYRTGESYHQIAWKHYARTGELFSKVHWGEEHSHYLIPWQPGGRNAEEYLRVMSGWVAQAVESGASFQMETPQHSIEPGRGWEHAKICWRALAAVNVNMSEKVSA